MPWNLQKYQRLRSPSQVIRDCLTVGMAVERLYKTSKQEELFCVSVCVSHSHENDGDHLLHDLSARWDLSEPLRKERKFP